MNPHTFSVGQHATAACLLEASAPKPGNVHRSADFHDMTFYDMCLGAVAIAPAMEQARTIGPGAAALEAVTATQAIVGKNTNLGSVLLLAPLAASVNCNMDDVQATLDSLTTDDALYVYEAIRLVRPGGLGTAAAHDVFEEKAPQCLISAMELAANRDMVARQYAEGFFDIESVVVPLLCTALDNGWSVPDSVVYVQMQLMERFPDSLIVRKLGPRVAAESSHRAADVLQAGVPGEPTYTQALADFDFWLRSDGHERNPGTTADLIAAGLFMTMRRGLLTSEHLQRVSLLAI
jgi:triphosphoribosyl-dephospho-CoA synthase